MKDWRSRSWPIRPGDLVVSNVAERGIVYLVLSANAPTRWPKLSYEMQLATYVVQGHVYTGTFYSDCEGYEWYIEKRHDDW